MKMKLEEEGVVEVEVEVVVELLMMRVNKKQLPITTEKDPLHLMMVVVVDVLLKMI